GAVGGEGGGSHNIGVAGKSSQNGAGGGIPEFGGVVTAAGQHLGSVGGEGNSVHLSGVPGEGSEAGAGGGVPEPGGVIPASGQDLAAIGGEGDGGYPIGMSAEGLQVDAGRGVEQLRIPGCAEKDLRAVQRECDAVDLAEAVDVQRIGEGVATSLR